MSRCERLVRSIAYFMAGAEGAAFIVRYLSKFGTPYIQPGCAAVSLALPNDA
jgi:hypothetical protein